MATSNIGFQSFYQSQLTSAISNTDLTIPLDVLPTPSEGYLVIESTISAQREIIYYTSKTGTAVVVPSGTGNGRGFDGTTAVSHTQGATVIMAPIGAMFGNQAIKDMLGITADPTGSWNLLAGGAPTVSSVTANGNRSYTINFASDYSTTLSPGMRLKTTRTVAAPTQCTSLNGSSQYYNKTSPAGMTFTDDFVVSAWVKLNSYSTNSVLASRFNGTSGWQIYSNTEGRLVLTGYNGGAANTKTVFSVQSIPLNKWVHIAAQLDMSAITGTNTGLSTTQNYIMFDGLDVPAASSQGGTNPTTLVQAGNLEIGSNNGGSSPFNGKIAQVAIYSAKVTQANIRATISQGLTGSETSLISAYSFNNSINDLNTTNANNLTAQGSAVATNADSPFGCQADGTISSTLDYSIISKIATTAVTVQVPEGCTIPTTGGVAGVSYATVKVPYGFPVEKNKWTLQTFLGNFGQVSLGSLGTWFISDFKLAVPIGKWILGIQSNTAATSSVSGVREGNFILSSAAELPSLSANIFNDAMICHFYAATGNYWMGRYVGYKDIDISAQTTYSLYGSIQSSTGSESWYVNKTNEITAECAYL